MSFPRNQGYTQMTSKQQGILNATKDLLYNFYNCFWADTDF
ncbi:hypothetical protein RAT170B_0058 [Rickettsia argasii T170-B]|uniref:Uncharacterized protein n=1 Tax=Rickettsia argasii T170-B TaxID=1268837 RepID=A0A0F3RGY0_9RICK|nr:hypothetical protein RAT170B_0058 [Rickettsia argasii T170-B]